MQLGNQSDTNASALSFTFATDGNAPFMRRIEGAVSFVLSASAGVGGIGVSKTWQFDAIRIDYQSGTEAFMALTPSNETTVIVTPSTAAPARWDGVEGVLVTDFYPAGQMAATESGGLAYSAADPEAGETVIWFAPPDGMGGFDAPVEVGRAAGVVDVAVAERADGSWVAAWSEVDEAQLGDPFAETPIRFATSDDGATWSSPSLLADPGGYAYHLQAVGTGDDVVVTWMLGQGLMDESPSVELASVGAGDTASATLEVHAGEDIVGVALAGAFGDAAPEATVLVRMGDGTVEDVLWDGAALAEPVDVAADAFRGVAAAYDADDRGLGVIVHDASMTLHRRDGDAVWAPLSESFAGTGAVVESAVLALGSGADTVYVVAWIQAGTVDQLTYATFAADGVLVDEPTAAPNEAGYRFRGLSLMELSGDPPGARAVVVAETPEGDYAIEFVIEPGTGIFPPDGELPGRRRRRDGRWHDRWRGRRWWRW